MSWLALIRTNACAGELAGCLRGALAPHALLLPRSAQSEAGSTDEPLFRVGAKSRATAIRMWSAAVLCALALKPSSVRVAQSPRTSAPLARADAARHAPLDRRGLLGLSAMALAAAAAWPAASSAASSVPTIAELENLVIGYRGIVGLLENWDDETIKCDKFDSAEKCGTAAQKREAASSNMASCSCDFNPGRVQEVMGFKSIKHPLYMADQLMIRAQPLLSPTADTDVYDAAVESWSRKAENANVMSFTSSWGEANPGGGRDAVAKYLARSKKEVQDSAELLRTILTFLPVKV